MKQSLVRILDILVPPDIKEFEQSEELARARALLLLLLVNFIASIAALLADLLVTIPAELANSQTRAALLICIASYAFAILIFRRTGYFAVSGNIYAFSYCAAVLISVYTLPKPDSLFFLFLILPMPVLVTFVANYLSGILWLIAITLSPLLLHTVAHLDIWSTFIGNWILACFALFLAIYIGHNYREGMSQRLNTERSKFEFAAAHDALTGLANRTTFDRRLRESIEFCTLHGTQAVLAYIDLDKFKPINDTYGHQAGDIVLASVADRLRRQVRGLDTVARLGGDEFAILFDQCSPASVKPVIERIVTAIKEPIAVFDNELTVECSIGVVVCPDDGLRPEQLSHKADERMYEAKRKIETGTNTGNTISLH